jgi:hypothetical protein
MLVNLSDMLHIGDMSRQINSTLYHENYYKIDKQSKGQLLNPWRII